MSYCRYCGKELLFTKTANNKWLPYEVTGEPHFCNKDNKIKAKSGLKICKECGKPVFMSKNKKMDYTTLSIHVCRKIDITNYQKYLKRQKIKK